VGFANEQDGGFGSGQSFLLFPTRGTFESDNVSSKDSALCPLYGVHDSVLETDRIGQIN